MCVSLDNLTALPAATVKEVGGHVKVVQVDKRLQAGFARGAEQLVIPRGTFLVEVAVGIEQTAPLDGSAIGIQTQVLQNAKVFLVLGHKVIAGVRATRL